jgi:electron transfer flavoprotein beta subunit
MNILVLLKGVPLVGTERLEADRSTDRTQLEANGADEYCLEKALKLTEAHGGEVSVLSVGPAAAAEALRKALAMGAARAWHVEDEALAGSDIHATLVVLEAAIGRLSFDLLLCGADTSDGQGGVLGAALAARLRLPYLSYAAEIEPADPDGRSVRIHRLGPAGQEVLEASTPAVVMGTQLLGEPRYPSLRGIMAARSRETVRWSLDDLGIDRDRVGWAAAGVCVLSADPPAARGGAEVVSLPPDEAVARVISFLADRRLI